jgi:hypothetical protein
MNHWTEYYDGFLKWFKLEIWKILMQFLIRCRLLRKVEFDAVLQLENPGHL